MANSSEDNKASQINAEQKVLLIEEDLPNFFILHRVQVNSGEVVLVYRDGILQRMLGPGRHTWLSGFFHKWHIKRINIKLQFLPLTIKGRVKDSVSDVESMPSRMLCKGKVVKELLQS